MILVDPISQYPSGLWCHMAVDADDDLEELHAFAKRLGLKRSWFQDHLRLPHYDLRPSKRKLAVALGAVEVDPFEQVRRMKRPSKRKEHK